MRTVTFMFVALLFGLLHTGVASARITGLGRDDIPEGRPSIHARNMRSNPTNLLYLRRALGSGLYLCRLETPGGACTCKLVLLQ